ncbi:hypothetical protein [Halorarius halobius]|uniref:hypothetical protein n=1 Tax=Halorarius halobius TaxID=2962671 RepID=UPI0020CCD6D6|nr:hypothetical protein [Halorarius halobius]
MHFTRRQLLAGVGGAALAGGGLTAARGRTPAFSRYTYAAPDDDTDDGRLRVAWYETYNGAFLEHQTGTGATFTDALDPDATPEYVTEASGPVVSLSNVAPGDGGTLVVGLQVVDRDDAEPLDVYVRGRVTADDENTVNEPERAAGDDGGTDGELDSAVEIRLWKDGMPFGSCNGSLDAGETVVRDGPLATAFDPASQFGIGGELLVDCLAVDSVRCVAFDWSLPSTVGNVVQTDGVAFDIEFGGVPCGGNSPFAAEDAR